MPVIDINDIRMISTVPNITILGNEERVERLISVLKAEEKSEQTHSFILANTHFDKDHDRLVLTIFGIPTGVIRALKIIIDTVAEDDTWRFGIDSDTGVHPHTGIIDVIPLVPLDKSSEMKAREAAREIASYLRDNYKVESLSYGRLEGAEFSNTGTARRSMRVAKREGLGVSLIGVRDILIAFNLNISTDSDASPEVLLDKTKWLANTVRGEGVRTLGLVAGEEGCMQLSTNIDEWQKTSPAKLCRKVMGLLQDSDYQLQSVEIIGLMPKPAWKELQEFCIGSNIKILTQH